MTGSSLSRSTGPEGFHSECHSTSLNSIALHREGCASEEEVKGSKGLKPVVIMPLTAARVREGGRKSERSLTVCQSEILQGSFVLLSARFLSPRDELK